MQGFNHPVWQKLAIEHLRQNGYSGIAHSKQHYNGNESALTAYKKIPFNIDKVILVKSVSNGFCFRIEHFKL